MIRIEPLNERVLEDAELIVSSRFGAQGISLLHKVMCNPLRKKCPAAGYIAYEDGRPASLQAGILRNCYFKGEEFVGKVGGLTSSLPGASEAAYIDVQLAASRPFGGAVLGFGNSSNEKSSFVNRRSKKIIQGPESCSRYLWRAIRPIECGLYFIRRKLLKQKMPLWKRISTLNSLDWRCGVGDVEVQRLSRVEPMFFDVLMERYLRTNKGFACSRTAEVVDWIFGDRVRSGEAVILGAFDATGPCGYILLRSDCFAKRWVIHDWFAIENRVDLLESLLKVGCRFLKEKTPAMMLEVEGFPTWVQPLLNKYMPHVRKIGFNQFFWRTFDKEVGETLRNVVESQDSWFYGPYDGDECMS